MNVITNEDLRTFKDLFELLRSFNGNSKKVQKLLSLNKKITWFEIQESLLRLFAKLGCIEQLSTYTACDGNFNLASFKPIRCDHDIFYYNNKLICLKDSGDSSDLTMIKADEVLAISSKNLSEKNMSLCKLDIDKISFYDQSKYTLRIGLCVPSKEILLRTIAQSKKTTKTEKMKELLKNALILDQNDLIESFKLFAERYSHISFDELINRSLESIQIQYRPHQLYAINNTVDCLKQYESNEEYANILWGHVARSGKSYMMNGLIHALNSRDDENYLIITTAPNETVTQYINIVCTLKPLGFSIITDKTDALNAISGKNVIILSKQLMTNGSNHDLVIPNVRIIMFDEAHNGGSTTLSKTLLQKYDNCSKIFISATYQKISNEFGIDKTITWDLEDIELYRNGSKECMKQLNVKHPKFNKAIKQCEKRYKCDVGIDYQNYPKLNIVGLDLSNTDRVEINKDEWDWSLDTLFAIRKFRNKDKLKFEHSVKELFRYVIEDVIAKIEKFNIGHGQRTILNADLPSVIMCFIPSDKISVISNLLKTAINQIDNDLEVCICNTTDTSDDIKHNINQSLVIARNTKKKAVIALTGKQGHLGVTIEQCDLVLLMNNSRSMDYLYQSMFRCMTEAQNKTYGHVIDFNIDRSIDLIVEYGRSTSKGSISMVDSIRKIIKGNIINLSFSEQFEVYDKEIMITNILKHFQKPNGDRIDKYLKSLEFIDIQLSEDDLDRIANFILKRNISKQTTIVVHDDNEENGTIKLDSQITPKKQTAKELKEKKEKIEASRNFMRTIKHMIPIMCILTIGSTKSTSYLKMMTLIKSNDQLSNILRAQFKIWWKKEMSDNEFDDLTSLFEELGLQNNDEIASIVSTIKDIFIANKDNREELSKSVSKYLVPAEIEKKSNAEVATPYELKQNMLDTIPTDFWKTPQKVLEPCCGKSGFILDIIDRFLKGGLSYRKIVEECIYFADISSLNIFITKLIIDPNNEYALNYFVGDTLLMEFDVMFDAVIGNPPYNSSGTIGSGNTIWQHFTRKSIQEWTVEGGYVLMIHPSGWRKPEYSTSESKTDGMFKLMTSENTMIKLVIRGLVDGKKAFGCGTRYDYYLIQRIPNTGILTLVDDERYNVDQANMSEWNWFPNHSYRLVGSILANEGEEKLSVIYNTKYDPRNNFVSYEESEEFKYPLIHSTPKAGIRYCYSSVNNKGHFGISKVIFGESGINDVVIDLNGAYGMTQGAFALEVSDEATALLYKEALLSNQLKLVLNACLWGNFRIEWKLFCHFKKDFYEYLINE